MLKFSLYSRSSESRALLALVQLFTIATARSGPTGKRIQQFARPLGALTVILGLVVLVIGARTNIYLWNVFSTRILLAGGMRYFKTQNALVDGKFPVARKTVIFLSALLTCLVAVTFGILVAIPS